MDREGIIAALRAHERELKAAGVVSLSVFGSVARGDDGPGSDVDVAVRLGEGFARSGFDYFGELESLGAKLARILDRRVDVVEEPVRKPRLQHAIDRDRLPAF